jgi:N-methylhydantoinase A
MRYRGQGHEVAVTLPNEAYGAQGGALLHARFEAAYRALYGRTIPGLTVEALSWTLALAEARPLPSRVAEVPRATAPPPSGTRRLTDPGTGLPVEAAIHSRAELPPGARILGPAVIVESETATLIPTGFSAGPIAGGHILIERLV